MINFSPRNSYILIYEEDYIIINPNASDLRIERRWCAENFILLIQHICNKYEHLKIYLIGSKNEQDYVQNIVNKINHKRQININKCIVTTHLIINII